MRYDNPRESLLIRSRAARLYANRIIREAEELALRASRMQDEAKDKLKEADEFETAAGLLAGTFEVDEGMISSGKK